MCCAYLSILVDIHTEDLRLKILQFLLYAKITSGSFATHAAGVSHSLDSK